MWKPNKAIGLSSCEKNREHSLAWWQWHYDSSTVTQYSKRQKDSRIRLLSSVLTLQYICVGKKRHFRAKWAIVAPSSMMTMALKFSNDHFLTSNDIDEISNYTIVSFSTRRTQWYVWTSRTTYIWDCGVHNSKTSTIDQNTKCTLPTSKQFQSTRSFTNTYIYVRQYEYERRPVVNYLVENAKQQQLQ